MTILKQKQKMYRVNQISTLSTYVKHEEHNYVEYNLVAMGSWSLETKQ